MLKHKDSKENSKKVSSKKFYSRLLFQRTCDFNVLLYSGRLFQQYLCEMFVKVDSERLSWIRYNQSNLRASDYSHLSDLLADAANHNNEINQCTGNNESNNELKFGRLVALPSTHMRSDRCMRQKMHDIIAISNTPDHPDIFITMICTHVGLRYKTHYSEFKELTIDLIYLITFFA